MEELYLFKNYAQLIKGIETCIVEFGSSGSGFNLLSISQTSLAGHTAAMEGAQGALFYYRGI
jgi:hypothetical protein